MSDAQIAFAKALGPPVERRLQNGLTVVVQEDHRGPLVSLALRYDAGERVVPEGARGVALLTSALMFRATKHLADGEYGRLLWRAGAAYGDSAGRDANVFSVTLPSREIELPLWLWSDQMAFFAPAVNDGSLTEKRGWLREQRRLAVEGTPLGHLDDFAAEELYPPGHPYHGTRAGTPESVAAIDRASVLAFHDRWMTPDHATLVVVGDVDPTATLAQVERYFGPIPRGNTPKLEIPPPPRLVGETQVDVLAKTTTARLSIRWPTPRDLTTEDARLEVLAHLLKGKRAAFLYWELVDNEKIATEVTARQRSRALGSEFEVTVEGAPGKSASDLLAAFDAAMDVVSHKVPTAGQLAAALYETTIDRAYSYEHAMTRAEDFARYVALAGTASYAINDFRRYEGITAPVVTALFARFLPRDRRVVFLVTPGKDAAPGGERTGRRMIPARAP
jgi:zinc protease